MRFVTAKARPPITGGRVGLLRLHLIGTTHEDRIRNPDRAELQGVSKASCVGTADNLRSVTAGLVRGGRHYGVALHHLLYHLSIVSAGHV